EFGYYKAIERRADVSSEGWAVIATARDEAEHAQAGRGMMPAITPEMRQCIQECQSCHSSCLETVTHCLRKGGRHAEEGHIRLMLDCVEICQTSADFMLRGSDLHTRTC